MSINPVLLGRPPSFIPADPVCLQVVSRDLSGRFGSPLGEVEDCPDMDCFTRRTTQKLRFDATANEECDEGAGAVLDTTIFGRVEHLFKGQTGGARGIHSGTVFWTLSQGHGRGTGNMRGVTNAGTHRAPVFRACEGCDAPTMQGSLEATATIGPGTSAPRVVLLRAVYKIALQEPGEEGLVGNFKGTLEGVVMFFCDL